MQSETRICQNCKKDFVIEPNDFGFYEKIKVPPPTFCPECRLQRRLIFRNERNYYKRICDLCNTSIIAVYPPDFKTPVYCGKCWWSDKWDPTEYGKNYDPSKSFLEQFKELFYTVPMLAMQNDDGIASLNCQYTYDLAFSKNCYLVMCDWETENAAYSFHVDQSKDIFDSYYSNNCNFGYELITSSDCYQCSYLTLSIACNNCVLGFDLRACSDCILCVGLRNKKYCIWNQEYSKEEYENKKKELELEKREKLIGYQKELIEFSLKFPKRYAHIFKSIYTTGDNLWNCKAARDCFYFKELENSRYMLVGDRGKDSYDCNNTGRTSLCYESITPDNSYHNIAAIFCWKCTQAEYSNNCHSSQYVFGCSGVKHGEYMILNKKYSKEEYKKLREKIKSEMITKNQWGEFFPREMSPHAYNESPAQDWIPLNEEQAILKGFRWAQKEKREYDISLTSDKIPQTITEVEDSILNEIIGCADAGNCSHKCTIAFKIIPMELAFYRRMNIPLPNLCHNCRYYHRIKQRNPFKLWHRTCMCDKENHEHEGKCQVEFETSYAPDRPEIVYCEKCYQKEVY
ncbi:MAG: hypothetical protein WCS86_03555 [Candidatus Paceibacterota bacterium]